MYQRYRTVGGCKKRKNKQSERVRDHISVVFYCKSLFILPSIHRAEFVIGSHALSPLCHTLPVTWATTTHTQPSCSRWRISSQLVIAVHDCLICAEVFWERVIQSALMCSYVTIYLTVLNIETETWIVKKVKTCSLLVCSLDLSPHFEWDGNAPNHKHWKVTHS